MRVFHLRLESSDFTSTVDGRWESPVIDLYDNLAYKNYSTVKTSYGMGLGTYVWAGINKKISGDLIPFNALDLANQTWADEDGLITDSGFVDDGRFVDTSGQVDLISYQVDLTSDVEVTTKLDIYGSDLDDSEFPNEWTLKEAIKPEDEIGLVNVDRYAKFVLNFSSQPTDAVFYIRVEISRPVIAPFYARSYEVLSNFPRWMELRDLDAPFGAATPIAATPTSLGAKLVNAISGEWLDDLTRNLTYLNYQRYIDTVDLNQKAWVFKSVRMPEPVFSVEGDGIVLGAALDQRELYETTTEEHVYWLDEESDELYSNLEYDELLINGVAFTQSPHHVWNALDELGLFVDLRRLPLEENDHFRLRILDVHRNPLGVGSDEFKLALRRELDLWNYASPSSTPDSDYLGATPTVLEMEDVEQDDSYVYPDGLPTDKFITLVDNLSREYPITWGRFRWDQAVWDMGGANHEGFGTLPYQIDATPLTGVNVQTGVGDGNDLYVFRPDIVTGAHEFQAKLRLRGRQKISQIEYPPVEFEFNIHGRADKKIYDNPEIEPWVSVEINTSEVGDPTYVASFQMTAVSDVSASNPTPTELSHAYQPIFDQIDDMTEAALDFRNKATNAAGGRIPFGSVQSITLRPGKWNFGTTSYDTFEASDNFEAWMSHDEDDRIVYNTNSAFPTMLGEENVRPIVELESKETDFVVGEWTSEVVPYTISLNGVSPYTSGVVTTVTLPEIVWDNYLEDPPNKEYVIELVTTNGAATPTYGAYSRELDGDDTFLDESYLRINGDGTWVDGYQKILPESAVSMDFSVGSGDLYPVNGNVWVLFERTQNTTYEGVVDENGPWHNGQAPSLNNSNFNFETALVGRADFDLPESPDYVVTWMGVDVIGDPQVIAWLDNNTVIPAVEVPNYVETPESAAAIHEILVGGAYEFQPFVIRARLNPDPPPSWNPQIHSGYFYDRDTEYYMYARAETEYVQSGEAVKILERVTQQGAPIIVKTDEATPRELRQVTFFDDAASPTSLTLTNAEVVKGTGTTSLYMAYPNIKDIEVVDLTTGSSVAADDTSDTNVVTVSAATDKDTFYRVTYRVVNSFYADNQYEQTGATPGQFTKLVFDASPSTLGVSQYSVTYEGSIYNPATPVDVPLSPLFTTLDEGYIFISHNEYTLERATIYLSPSKIIADGQDYLLINIYAEDQYGNPKMNREFELETTFGTLDHETVTTDKDGYAVVILTSELGTSESTGTLTVSGEFNATATFDIDLATARGHRLIAAPSASEIPADARSQIVVFGRVEDPDYVPIPGAEVRWKKARSIYELFAEGAPTEEVIADAQGTFNVGPFTAASPDSPGYWFVSVESDSASPSGTWDEVGDVVYWYEHPDQVDGVENMTGLPRPPIQMATPIGTIPPYATPDWYPVTYDDATPYAPATPSTIIWMPPVWFVLRRYRYFQLGLLGPFRNRLDIALALAIRPRRWRIWIV